MMTLINSSRKGMNEYHIMLLTSAPRCNVLIATPGRLADLLQLEDFGLSHSVKSLVSISC